MINPNHPIHTTLPPQGLAAWDLHYRYQKQPVLRGAELQLQQGECVALLGRNGAGKSTLLRLLLGFADPMQGSVWLDGKPLTSYSRQQLARAIAYVPQQHQAPFPYSAHEVVMLGRLPHHGLFGHPSEEDEAQVEQTLQRLRISHLAHRPYTRLSGGERQLVMIARALAQEARLLILDEPVNGLDYGNQYRLLETLATLAADGLGATGGLGVAGGLGILMTTHHPEHALHAASRVILLDEGRILQSGAPEAVLTPTNLQQLYDLPIACHTLQSGRRVLLPERAAMASSGC